ncbi:MAG: HIT family protein [Candidatus Nanoarchaeia archaeon]
MENCVFCKIIKGEIPAVKIWEDEKHIAMLDINPIKPGHVLLIPKKHSEYIFDLDDKEYNLLMVKAKEIAKKLKLKLNSKRIGLAIEGFGVPHIHVHLIPIDKENDLNSKRMRPLSAEELNKMADKLK